MICCLFVCVCDFVLCWFLKFTLHIFIQAYNEAVNLGQVYTAEKGGIPVAGFKKWRATDFKSKDERVRTGGAKDGLNKNCIQDFNSELESMSFELDFDKLTSATIVICKETKEAQLSDEWRTSFVDAVKAATTTANNGIRFLQKVKSVCIPQYTSLKGALGLMTTKKNEVQHLLDFNELSDGKSLTVQNVDELMVGIAESMSSVCEEIDHVKITLKNRGIAF